MNYIEAETILNGRTSRKLQPNTYLHRLAEGEIGLFYHKSYIISYKANSCKIYLNNHIGRSTINRINRYSPMKIINKNNILYILDVDTKEYNIMFYNGIKVNYDGRILSKKKVHKIINHLICL